MKTQISALLLAFGMLVFMGCSDNDSEFTFESTATIQGVDLTLCACCGGIIIDIDGEEESKRFDDESFSPNVNFDLDYTNLPIRVQLNWTESEQYCGQGITIEAIERMN